MVGKLVLALVIPSLAAAQYIGAGAFYKPSKVTGWVMAAREVAPRTLVTGTLEVAPNPDGTVFVEYKAGAMVRLADIGPVRLYSQGLAGLAAPDTAPVASGGLLVIYPVRGELYVMAPVTWSTAGNSNYQLRLGVGVAWGGAR